MTRSDPGAAAVVLGPPGGRRRPPRRALVLLLAGVLAVSGGTLVVAGLAGDAEPVAAAPAPVPTPDPVPTTQHEPRGLPTPVPTSDPEPQPTAAAALDAEADISVRVPAVGIDLPVHALEPDGGAINPPTMTDAYWISPYGEPGSGAQAPDNTVYIAAHSWSRGDAAFNDLLDADHVGGAVEAGDVVEVDTPSGTTAYAVTDVRRYGKDELPGADEVWEVSPGRLVLITCFQREDGGRSTENLVVTAEQVPAAA